MKYHVYKQLEPLQTDQKDRAGRFIFKANILLIGQIDIPFEKCPIEYARNKFDIDHPMVSAVNGYDEEGKVRLNLQ